MANPFPWLQYSLTTKTSSSRLLIVDGVSIVECRTEPFLVFKPLIVGDMPDVQTLALALSADFLVYITRGSQPCGYEIGKFKLRLKKDEKTPRSETIKLEQRFIPFSQLLYVENLRQTNRFPHPNSHSCDSLCVFV